MMKQAKKQNPGVHPSIIQQGKEMILHRLTYSADH